MAKVLIADDDIGLIESLIDLFVFDDYHVDVAHDGSEADHFLDLYDYDLIILDWKMPKRSGVEVCRRFRAAGGCTPILILSANSSIDEKEAGLEAGADDYLSKPFHIRELRVRMKALRRRGGLGLDKLVSNNIEVETGPHRVAKDNVEIKLQPLEFNLLEFFMRNPNRVFSPEELLSRVWDSQAVVSTQAIYTAIKRLRSKIETAGQAQVLVNIHGSGYMFKG